ncbi:hypothetical protein ACF0H5_013311 [Mactra antiquata]
MKIAVFVLACCLGLVVSESCTSLADCQVTTCSNGFEKHCLDNFCLCLSPATGATCNESNDCEHADHNHEHCQFSQAMEWKCVHHTCRCVADD